MECEWDSNNFPSLECLWVPMLGIYTFIVTEWTHFIRHIHSWILISIYSENAEGMLKGWRGDSE